jgi:2-haloacid dehalogenase
VFDVNETLSDMAPLAGRFADVGAPELLAKVWFASLLRDGFALAATGGKEAFSRPMTPPTISWPASPI